MRNYLDELLPELKLLILKYVIYYNWSIVNCINNTKFITNDKLISQFKLKTICDIIEPRKITYKTYLNDSIYFNDIKISDREFKTIIKKYEFRDAIEYFNRRVFIFKNIPEWYVDGLKFTFKFANNTHTALIKRIDYYKYFNIILLIYYYKLLDKKRTYKGYNYNMKATNADTGVFEIIFK